MLCQEGMTTIKARSALSIPQNTKQATPTKTQSNTRKIDKYCTNYGMTNHNVETCKKKEQTIVATTNVTQRSQNPQQSSSHACHICGLNGHKMRDCPKFVEMHKMFHGKYVAIVKVKPIAKTQTISTYVNVVDANVTKGSKATKKHVSKDKELEKQIVSLTRRKKNG